MEIAIYGSRRQHDYGNLIRKLVINLIMDGASVSMHDKLYDHLTVDLGLSLAGVRRVFDCPDNASLAMSIGGDGTLLRTVAWMKNRNMPLLGINTGNLGYLTAMSLEQAVEDTTGIVNLDFRRERHSMLHVDVPGFNVDETALNEVVVSKEDSASMITAETTLNDTLLAKYKADGLIVSTPTGSTAYNLSVGGPIVEPTAPVWVISPIAAHSLSLRPLVVSDTSTVRITVQGRGNRYRLVVDGRAISLPIGTTVTVQKSERSIEILQLRDRKFTDIIGSKLLFNI